MSGVRLLERYPMSKSFYSILIENSIKLQPNLLMRSLSVFEREKVLRVERAERFSTSLFFWIDTSPDIDRHHSADTAASLF